MKRKVLKGTAARVFHQPGDAIEGERVAAQYRSLHSVRIQTGTASHQIQQSKLEGTVFCMIEKPLNYLRGMVERGEKLKGGPAN